jgi:hypothetical protein
LKLAIPLSRRVNYGCGMVPRKADTICSLVGSHFQSLFGTCR